MCQALRRCTLTQVKLNKASLSHEQKSLKNYKQFLPSLDLKRRKLLMEKNKATAEYEQIKNQIRLEEDQLDHKFPMLANTEIKLDNIITIKSIETKIENIVGINMPIIKEVQFNVCNYEYFNTPHWLDSFINELKKMIEMRIRLQIAEQRIQLINKSLQIVTQRTNLFEKVLIPKSISIIRSIQIFLTDNERAAVVRSKMTKQKRQLK